jgi:hypothetical protein
MRKMAIGRVVFLFFLGGKSYPLPTLAEMELRLGKELDLKSDPFDAFQSLEGEQLFILTPGEVLLYSLNHQSITGQISAEKESDRIAFSFKHKTLTLISKINKKILIHSLEIIRKFNIFGLSEAKIQEIAREIGLNVGKFNSGLNNLRFKSWVKRALNQARQADIRGIPAFIISGRQQTHRRFQ